MTRRTVSPYTVFLGFVFATIVLGGCTERLRIVPARSAKPRRTVAVTDASIPSWIAGNTEFACDLYRELAKTEGNFILSPFSATTALSMVYAGAGGGTAADFERVLHLPDGVDPHRALNAVDTVLTARSEDPENFVLNTANAMWAQEGVTFAPSFLDVLAVDYGAGVRLVDFSHSANAADEINAWVAAETNGHIEKLVRPEALNSNTRCVLTNAVYLDADWLQPFEGYNTSDDLFYLEDRTFVHVSTMASDGRYRYFEGDCIQAISLPYRGQAVSMLFVVPDFGRLRAFEDDLTGQRLTEILGSLSPSPVQLSVPKFKFESAFSMRDALSTMGLSSAFEEPSADFSKAGVDGPPLFVGDVVHRAMIAVDERGTTAAASTSVDVRAKSATDPRSVTLQIDRPFLVVVHDARTGGIIFMGRVADPRG